MRDKSPDEEEGHLKKANKNDNIKDRKKKFLAGLRSGAIKPCV